MLHLCRSSSLCAGNLHPDNVLHLEKQFKLNKRAYYHEINKYHSGYVQHKEPLKMLFFHIPTTAAF